MATMKFFIRTSTKVEKLVPIYCRFIIGRNIDYKVKTGLMVIPKYWNNTKQQAKYVSFPVGVIKERTERVKKEAKDTADKLNNTLLELKAFINNRSTNTNEKIDKKWLITTIESYFNPNKGKEKAITLFSFIQDFIDKAPTRTTPKTGNPVCYKQLREYERTFHYLKEYAKEKKRKIDFIDITLDFYHDFVQFLQSEKTVIKKTGEKVKETGLAKNTIGKKIQTLKIFLNAASDQGINENKQYKSHRFTAISEETESIYLDETELQAIYKLDLSGSHLEKIRDLFIVGCWTGLRFSDWDKITPANIDNGFLELKQEKTGGAVVIYLHPTVEAILNKYDGQLPKAISNQKFNDYLKEVAREAGLTEKVHKSITKGGVKTSVAYPKCELVTTHTGRRSFATNLYKAGLPSLTILQVTGHKTEQAFLKYIKVTSREHAEKLKEFWQNQVKLHVV